MKALYGIVAVAVLWAASIAYVANTSYDRGKADAVVSVDTVVVESVRVDTLEIPGQLRWRTLPRYERVAPNDTTSQATLPPTEEEVPSDTLRRVTMSFADSLIQATLRADYYGNARFVAAELDYVATLKEKTVYRDRTITRLVEAPTPRLSGSIGIGMGCAEDDCSSGPPVKIGLHYRFYKGYSLGYETATIGEHRAHFVTATFPLR